MLFIIHCNIYILAVVFDDSIINFLISEIVDLLQYCAQHQSPLFTHTIDLCTFPYLFCQQRLQYLHPRTCSVVYFRVLRCRRLFFDKYIRKQLLCSLCLLFKDTEFFRIYDNTWRNWLLRICRFAIYCKFYGIRSLFYHSKAIAVGE